jgi:hypothetical protein
MPHIVSHQGNVNSKHEEMLHPPTRSIIKKSGK